MEDITLYFKEGGSDKIYRAIIEPKDGGYPNLQASHVSALAFVANMRRKLGFPLN